LKRNVPPVPEPVEGTQGCESVISTEQKLFNLVKNYHFDSLVLPDMPIYNKKQKLIDLGAVTKTGT
jgi:hypothetical protein